jgi:NTP pyrophosphatase (non-canonical NTP hydrolase)
MAGVMMGSSDIELLKLRDRIRTFALDRDWDQFHTPKNLAMALVAEAGELIEPFQWLTAEQSKCLDSDQLSHVRDEVADVFIYLIRLADKLDIDLIESANKKIDANYKKYPVSESFGSAKKYTQK